MNARAPLAILLSSPFHWTVAVCWLLATAITLAAPPGPPPAAADELRDRRARAVEALRQGGGDRALLLLRAPPADKFAGDVDYPYRADNDIFYLTGIDEPGCSLLLAASELKDLGREVLFFTPTPEWLQAWVGEGMTREAAAARSGIDSRSVVEAREMAERLGALHGSARNPHGFAPPAELRALYFDAGAGFAAGKAATEPYAFLIETFGSAAFHLHLRAPGALVHPLRQVKSRAEVALLEKAIAATDQALIRAWRAMRPGIHEYEIRAVIEATFLAEGCSGWSFPPIVGSGPNSCVPHYGRHGRRTAGGDLVVLDIGAEYGGYAADVTRTVPVNGKFTPRQREVYEIVLRAQEAGIRAVRPGEPWSGVHAASLREVTAGLKRLGLIQEDGEVRKYFFHGTSHGLGLDVHDPMPHGTLKPGMVITVEPGIYIKEEALGIRIEDDVLVTEDGCRVLSTGAPKEIAEIEGVFAGREL